MSKNTTFSLLHNSNNNKICEEMWRNWYESFKLNKSYRDKPFWTEATSLTHPNCTANSLMSSLLLQHQRSSVKILNINKESQKQKCRVGKTHLKPRPFCNKLKDLVYAFSDIPANLIALDLSNKTPNLQLHAAILIKIQIQIEFKLGTRMKQSSITPVPGSGNFQTDDGLANLTLKNKNQERGWN